MKISNSASSSPRQSLRQWISPQPDFEAAKAMGSALNLPPLIAHFLMRRGCSTLEEARTFLSASLQSMPDPSTLLDCDRAATRLLDAIYNKERVTIYGDYDVDGVTSSALIWRFCRDVFQYEVNTYIPQRLVEGYGLNVDAIRAIHQSGAQVLITVDNGSSAHKEVSLAQELGMDVVIIDHHQVSDPEPPAFAHLNPHRATCEYPDKLLAAVGVAFMFLIQIRRRLRTDERFSDISEPNLLQYLDIVALGTVADVAQLRGVNRALVRVGLQEMARAPRPGVLALAEVSRSKINAPTAGLIGFKLGPRLNAAGRLDDARYGLRLLISDDHEEVSALADRVENYNRERQQIQKSIQEEAIAQAEMLPHDAPAIVVADPQWHHGVVGIVASRLVEHFHRPALVLGGEGESLYKGSGRSTSKVNLKTALDACAAHLITYGGHVAAAGMTIERGRLDAFKDTLWAHLIAEGHAPSGAPPLKADAEVSLYDIDETFLNHCVALGPFGHGNPTPKLIVREVRAHAMTLSGGAHLKLRFNLPSHLPQEAIGWGMGAQSELCRGPVDLFCVPEWDEYKGVRKIVLKLKDIKQSVTP